MLDELGGASVYGAYYLYIHRWCIELVSGIALIEPV
jgi:hypothetical protein